MVKKDVGSGGSDAHRKEISPSQKKPNVWKQYIWPVVKRIFRIIKLLISAFLLVCLIDFLAYVVLVRLGVLEWSDVAEFIWCWGTTGP